MTSVLVVDDEPRIRAVLVRWLAAEYETREAPDAETALGLITKSDPDVVLCDVQMPGHGGLWLMEQVRETFPRTAFVLATAITSAPSEEGRQAGVVDYLEKPFERADVMAAVGRAVEWRQAALARGASQPAAGGPIDE